MSKLLLLSGGIDSLALAAWTKPAICLTIDYGQRAARAEIQASDEICKALGLRHDTISVSIPSLGMGDMSDKAMSRHSKYPEFWPFRNQYLVTLGAMYALNHECSEVMIGAVATDLHVDGSQRFVELASELLSMQEGSVRLTAPAIGMTSTDLVRISGVPSEILGWAHSCHTSNLACGRCSGCKKHSEVMADFGWHR